MPHALAYNSCVIVHWNDRPTVILTMSYDMSDQTPAITAIPEPWSQITATHLEIGHLVDLSIFSNDLQRHDYKTGYKGNSPSNGHQPTLNLTIKPHNGRPHSWMCCVTPPTTTICIEWFPLNFLLFTAKKVKNRYHIKKKLTHKPSVIQKPKPKRGATYRRQAFHPRH